MDPKRHAWLARQLIGACGGLEAAAMCCRLSRSRLAEFCDHKAGAFMPADVVNKLEIYCGEPIYSRALFEFQPLPADGGDLFDEACAAVEEAAQLQKFVRLELAVGKRLSANQLREVNKLLAALEHTVREILAAADHAGAQT